MIAVFSHPPHSSSVLHFITVAVLCGNSETKFLYPVNLELVASLKSFFAAEFDYSSMFLFVRSNLGLSLCFAPVQCPVVIVKLVTMSYDFIFPSTERWLSLVLCSISPSMANVNTHKGQNP